MSFLYKKKLGDRFYFQDDTKFLFSIFKKITILKNMKQNFESGPRAAVCRPLHYKKKVLCMNFNNLK